MNEPIPTACPRCDSSLDGEEFYGICSRCRTELNAQFSGESREIAPAEYEPKMNVTPNAVAAKE